jgi:uncharacterized protein (TIGR02271 family)
MKHSKFDDQEHEKEQQHDKGGIPFEEVIPVIEESVRVNKKWVETGKVHISKEVSEHTEVIDIPLTHEEVEIERVEVNEVVDTLPPAVRYEGETMIIPVLKEVVITQVMLVEEIRITRKKVQTNIREEVKLKKEEIHINKTDLSPDQDQADK